MKYMELIKSIREENGLSQERLAKILQVSQKAVSNWENGQDKPSFDSVLLIYENFGITPNEIMDINNCKIAPVISPNDNRSVLSSEHKELINVFETLSQSNKQAVKAYIKGLKDSQ